MERHSGFLGCPGKQRQPFGGLYSQLYCLKYASYGMER